MVTCSVLRCSTSALCRELSAQSTGPAGCVIGWISYRRSQQIKALDLRLELRKQVSDVCADIEALPTLLEGARASRSAVSAAMGVLQSGASEIWKAALETDLTTVQALARELPDADETFQHFKTSEARKQVGGGSCSCGEGGTAAR